jgi:hypothetical protein
LLIRQNAWICHPVFAQGFAQRRQKQSAILIVDKNSLPLITSIHHVINRSLKLDPKFPRHLETFSSF